MRGFFGLALAATCSVLAPSTQAAFHLWEVGEVYSSADGQVQFIELTALAGSQQFLQNQQIRTTNSAGVSTFTFPTNLPTDSGGKTCLIGTASLASVPGGVTPNYIIPPNFIRRPIGGSGAAVTFVPASSTMNTINLPSDGQAALLRAGGNIVVTPTNSPKNFLNQSNSVVPVKIAAGAKSGNDFVISFPTARGVNGAAGPNYTIEGSGTVTPAAWTAATNVTGNGNQQSVAIPIDTATNQVFRLRVP